MNLSFLKNSVTMSSLSSSSEPLLLEKQNHHPRDSRITFREHDHKYFVAVSISVTGLIGSLFPEFKEREVCEKMLDSRVFPTLPKHNVYRNMPIWARVENEGDTLVVNTHWCKGAYIYGREKAIDLILAYWEANRVQAASLGTAMHRDIELTLNGVEVKNETKEYGYFLEYRGMMEKAGWQPYRTEQTLFDQLLDLAGSCDMQFTRGERDEEGRLKIMVSDWKRSKKIETEKQMAKRAWSGGAPPRSQQKSLFYSVESVQVLAREVVRCRCRWDGVRCVSPGQSHLPLLPGAGHGARGPGHRCVASRPGRTHAGCAQAVAAERGEWRGDGGHKQQQQQFDEHSGRGRWRCQASEAEINTLLHAFEHKRFACARAVCQQ